MTLTVSFLLLRLLLWDRERLMLKKEEESFTSLPLLARRGGDTVTDWPRPPPERLSMLGEELTVLEVWPDQARRQG